MTPRIAATDGPSTDSTTRHTDQRQPAVRVGWRIENARSDRFAPM